MEITYKTRKIEKVCTIASEAEKKYGSEMAEKIHQRIDEIYNGSVVKTKIKDFYNELISMVLGG